MRALTMRPLDCQGLAHRNVVLLLTLMSMRACHNWCRSRTAVAPLERLKILMQVQGNQKVYTGVWQGLKHMARTEGIRGMMKGNLANCIRIVPNSAVKFLTYEQLSRWAC